jgi:choline dehydrogenase-like flavoprotein
MDSFEFLIVGSGPAGVAAARRLKGSGTCIVDVGDDSKYKFPFASLREGLLSGDHGALLGCQWEMLANLADPGRIHPKLRAPGVRHVFGGDGYCVYGRDGNELVHGHGSFAAGGMANCWGAQLIRYTQADLEQAGDWPISADALEANYTDLEEHIGISGAHDDMEPFLGGENSCLQPAVPIVPTAEYFLRRYSAHGLDKKRKGLLLGRARLAVLTRPHRGFPAHSFGETEFFSTEQPGIYTPRRTLAELSSVDQVRYLDKHKLTAFHEFADHVEISVVHTETGEQRRLRARHLLLGCGTILTARQVLINRGGSGRSLPFIDHPPTLLPVFFPAMFGNPTPEQSFPVQLIGTLAGDRFRDMFSFYYPGGMLRSDLLPDIPLPFDAARLALGVLMGGMLVAQIWEASHPSNGNRLSLNADGSIRIDYPDHELYTRLAELLASLRKFGGFSLRRLASMPPPSWGFHHAGCLPMRRDPAPFETHVDGRLWDSKRIRIIDGSVLPSLPAKNHSLTLMANAARIADETKLCGY